MFCKYCGKEVPDGQTCTCGGAAAAASAAQQSQQTQQPQNNVSGAAPAAGSDIGKKIADAFKSIPGAAKTLLHDFTGKGIGLPAAIIFACVSLLAYILGCICMSKAAFGGANNVISALVGKSMTGSMVWAGILFWLISLALPFLIVVVFQAIRKEKLDWAGAFVCASSVTAVPSLLFFVSTLIMFILPTVAMALVFIAYSTGAAMNAKLMFKRMGKTNSVVAVLIIGVVLGIALVLRTALIGRTMVSVAAGLIGGSSFFG